MTVVRTGPKPGKQKVTYFKKGGAAKSRGSKICPAGKAWAKRTFDTYPSAYANMAASKYCKPARLFCEQGLWGCCFFVLCL